MEIWKDIPNYEGLYRVSNTGKVRSLDRYHHRRVEILKEKTDKYGYKCVTLYKNSKRKMFTVHRLVMMTFIGKSNLTVNHIDKDKTNNNLSNLEYMTIKDNVRYSLAQPIVATKIENGRKIYFKSMKQLKEKGFSQGNVWGVLHRVYSQTKGYKWSYDIKEVQC